MYRRWSTDNSNNKKYEKASKAAEPLCSLIESIGPIVGCDNGPSNLPVNFVKKKGFALAVLFHQIVSSSSNNKETVFLKFPFS